MSHYKQSVNGEMEMVKTLFSHQYDVNKCTNCLEATPHYLVLQNCYEEIENVLLVYNDSTNLTIYDGTIPLHVA